MRKIRKYL